MEREFTHAVFIGRFSPWHLGHLEAAKRALAIAEHLVIIVGSDRAAPTFKNPFSFEDRKQMILLSLGGELPYRTTILNVKDYLYNDNLWVTEVQTKVNDVLDLSPDHNVVLVGSYKDSSSYYLKLFPQWTHLPCPLLPYDATTVREAMFCGKDYAAMVPPIVGQWLAEFEKSDTFATLQGEFNHVLSYKKQWAAVPYPPFFVTGDCVVIQSGHILMVRRRSHPGKGLLALPGGFIRQNESILDGTIRELYEETSLGVDKRDIRDYVVDSKVFDHPGRSLRGRTITHAYCFKLPDGPLKKVKANDDAEKCVWVSLRDFNALENECFEDHSHIVSYFSLRT